MKRRSCLRTIRIDEDIDGLLKDEATLNNVSVNSIINNILLKYSEWNRFTEKFGYVTTAHMVFKGLLEITDDEKLEDLARKLGQFKVKNVASFFFQEVSVDTMLRTFQLYAKYSGLCKLEIKNKGGDYRIVIHHDLGHKWSIFLKHMLGESIKNITNSIPRVEENMSEVVFAFKLS